MTAEKEKLLKLLSTLEEQQRLVSECHSYYQRLEKELDQKHAHLANPEDYADLNQKIETLSREYEEKSDLLYENLNETLLKGYDLAKKIGHEIAHDYKRLWDYMTDSVHTEVKLEHVVQEILHIKKLL